jgi:hypothetical protein
MLFTAANFTLREGRHKVNEGSYPLAYRQRRPGLKGVRLSTVRVDPGACPIPPGKLRFFPGIEIAEDTRRFNQLPA